MKKIPWGEIALGAVVGFWVTIIIVKLLGLFGGLLGKLTADNIINLIGVVASLGAIYAVFKSTERQIKNQNKENHRPYITAKYTNQNYNDKTERTTMHLNYNNIGYGICTNFRSWENSKFTVYEDVGKDDDTYVLLGLNKNESVSRILLYSDLYGNMYNSLIVCDENNVKIYQQNSSEFKKYIETIDYDEIIQKYRIETGL